MNGEILNVLLKINSVSVPKYDINAPTTRSWNNTELQSPSYFLVLSRQR